jgi:hypothetical protein
MNQGLAQLIRDYQAAVEKAVELLECSGIPRPATPTDWVGYDIPQRGQLAGGVNYFKHGYGCAVFLPSGKVDFDFGAEGQINGFDLWRLTGFAGKWLKNYGFTSEQAVKSAFQSAIESGEIVPSAYILHYLAPNAA